MLSEMRTDVYDLSSHIPVQAPQETFHLRNTHYFLPSIPHIGSPQVHRASQTRWQHHNHALRSLSTLGLADREYDCHRKPHSLSVFVVTGSSIDGWRRSEDKATPWSTLPLGKIVVLLSLSLAPVITGRCVPTPSGTTSQEPTPRTTERSTPARAAPGGLPS